MLQIEMTDETQFAGLLEFKNYAGHRLIRRRRRLLWNEYRGMGVVGCRSTAGPGATLWERTRLACFVLLLLQFHNERIFAKHHFTRVGQNVFRLEIRTHPARMTGVLTAWRCFLHRHCL